VCGALDLIHHLIPIRDDNRYIDDAPATVLFSLSASGGEVAILSSYTEVYFEMVLSGPVPGLPFGIRVEDILPGTVNISRHSNPA